MSQSSTGDGSERPAGPAKSHGIRVRRATPADAVQLVRFNCAMAQETEGIQLDPEVVDAGVRAVFERPRRGFYLVADAGEWLAGALMITDEWSDWRNGLFWWIQSVYVRPEHRRVGVYRLLYRHLQSMAEGHPEVCGFRLYVERGNRRAQRTYQAQGMTRTPYWVFESVGPGSS